MILKSDMATNRLRVYKPGGFLTTLCTNSSPHTHLPIPPQTHTHTHTHTYTHTHTHTHTHTPHHPRHTNTPPHPHTHTHIRITFLTDWKIDFSLLMTAPSFSPSTQS